MFIRVYVHLTDIPLSNQAPPTSLQLIVKTHTLALFLLTPISATLPSIKADTLSALQQFSADNEAQGIPVVTSEDQFELYWRKETTTGTGRNAITKEEYVPLDESKTIKQQGLLNWNPIYIRFRDESGMFLQYSCIIRNSTSSHTAWGLVLFRDVARCECEGTKPG